MSRWRAMRWGSEAWSCRRRGGARGGGVEVGCGRGRQGRTVPWWRQPHCRGAAARKQR
uniref:Uncharacterized protein n=1 Tax=Arundo donax TaxID=35708 RepID=A0A0A9C949_ARUDO